MKRITLTTKTQPPLDSRQLNAFVTLVRTGSFAETARQLFLTRSAISHSMRALESETGCRLLTKVGKSVIPTEAGEALLRHAQLGLEQFNQAREMLESLKIWGGRRFRVGADQMIDRRFLPPILGQLRRQHPRLLVSVRTLAGSKPTERLEDGSLDCLISAERSLQTEVESTPLFESALLIVVPAAHRWTSERRVPLEELRKEPCLLPERSSTTRALIEDYFARDRAVLNGMAEVESLETIRELVKTGLGIAILPELIIQDDLRSGALHGFPPGRRPLRLTWSLLRWRHRPIDSVEATFRNLCLAAVKSSPAASTLDFPGREQAGFGACAAGIGVEPEADGGGGREVSASGPVRIIG